MGVPVFVHGGLKVARGKGTYEEDVIVHDPENPSDLYKIEISISGDLESRESSPELQSGEDWPDSGERSTFRRFEEYAKGSIFEE